MRWLSCCLLVCVLPLTASAAARVLAWTYTTQPQDRGVVIERCVQQASGCPMRWLATVRATTRQYTDRTVQRGQRYCYQVGVKDACAVYQWSNTVCTP